MLILTLLVFGLLIGWLAQLALGKDTRNYAEGLIVGLAGSFIGGLGASLLAGDGLAIRMSGIVGSFIGAVTLLTVMTAVERRRQPVRQPKRR